MNNEGRVTSETLREFWGLPPDDGEPSTLDREFHLYLHEKYPHAGSSGRGALVRTYYAVKPVVPRGVQIWARQKFARKRAQTSFPSWPVESRCWDIADRWLQKETRAAGGEIAALEFWPEGRKCALVLTHDVELQSGFDAIKTITDIEEGLGLRSSWNIVPQRYRIDPSVIRHLWDRGHEVGVHGLKHDGKLFSSRRMFEDRLTAIHRYAEEWGAKGFRSPSTYRNMEWMQTMEFDYDASFYDTDPYEPQGGGCCHVFPYRLGRFIELPYTLPQDHTLLQVLKVDALEVWLRKAEWIRSVGGMILMITHPDYLNTVFRRRVYEAFLREVSGWGGVWHALPMEVARWWRNRLASHAIRDSAGAVRVVGPDLRARGRLFSGRSEASH